MSTKPEVCRHGDNPEECISCAMLARRPSKFPPRMANDPKPSPDWIAKAAKEAATVIVDGAYELHQRPVIGNIKQQETNDVAAIIQAAIERNAK